MGNEKEPQSFSDIDNIVVTCPIPGQEHQSMTVADFRQTERGQLYVDEMVGVVEVLESAGIDRNVAISKAFGAVALKDDSGELVRQATQIEPGSSIETTETVAATTTQHNEKKKLI